MNTRPSRMWRLMYSSTLSSAAGVSSPRGFHWTCVLCERSKRSKATSDQAVRMADGRHGRVDVEPVEAHAFMRAAVHAQGAAQLVGLGVYRPVLLRAQVQVLDARGRQHRAAETQLGDGSLQLLHGSRWLLQRDQRHGLEARAADQVLLVDVVVVGLAQGDGPVAMERRVGK